MALSQQSGRKDGTEIAVPPVMRIFIIMRAQSAFFGWQRQESRKRAYRTMPSVIVTYKDLGWQLKSTEPRSVVIS